MTPLRYTGGKTWSLPYVKDFLNYHNRHLGTIVEPFTGSASVSIGLLSSDLSDHAHLCESDPLLVSFWRSVFHNNEEFIDSVNPSKLQWKHGMSLENTWLRIPPRNTKKLISAWHSYSTTGLIIPK